MGLTRQGLAPMTRGSCMAERCPMLKKDDCVTLPEKIHQEITSAISSRLFHQKTPAHIWIVHVNRNLMCRFIAIAHQNTIAVMAQTYRNMIITAAHAVNNGDIAVEERQSSERLIVHTMPLIRYMGNAPEGWRRWGTPSMLRMKKW